MLVLFVEEGGITSTLLLFLAASGMGHITVVDHNDVEVSNLHWQIIHAEGRKGAIRFRSTHNSMRALNPIVSVTSVTHPLNWENSMELVRGNDCVVDARNNLCTWYLINDDYVLAGREPKTAAMTNGVSGRVEGTILLLSGSAMGTKGKLTVYNHQRGGVLLMPINQAQPYGSEKRFFCYR